MGQIHNQVPGKAVCGWALFSLMVVSLLRDIWLDNDKFLGGFLRRDRKAVRRLGLPCAIQCVLRECNNFFFRSVFD